MFRPLLALALLALALPAQDYHYKPTNLARGHSCTFADVQVIDGKLYAIFFHAPSWGSARVDSWFTREKQPSIVDISLHPAAVLAIDSRPCAHDGKTWLSWTGPINMVWSGAGPWLQMPPSGVLWWAGSFPYPLIGGTPEWGPELAVYFADYFAGGKRLTSCAGVNGPEFLALMFEVRTR